MYHNNYGNTIIINYGIYHNSTFCSFRYTILYGNMGRGGLVVNTPHSGSRGRGFEPHSGRRVVSLSKTYLPPKVLVIPRNRWLRPNMTEKLFTGTLSIKPNQTNQPRHEKPAFCMCENKRVDCFRYIDSTSPLLPNSEIPSLYSSHLVCGLCWTGRKPRRQAFS